MVVVMAVTDPVRALGWKIKAVERGARNRYLIKKLGRTEKRWSKKYSKSEAREAKPQDVLAAKEARLLQLEEDLHIEKKKVLH